MTTIFESASPEALGIPAQAAKNFLLRLEKLELPMHSAIIMRHDKICLDAYYAPYDRNSLHRMFSITKSFVSLAIGFLEEEGLISLDDHIVDYFPEKLPERGAHPYTQMLTIRQMLTMRTCHNQTTYKLTNNPDWTETFFTTTPSHVPGTNFSYDTSSTHTLGALVEKLTGMELLDYLRVKFLDEIGFSKDAYVLKDPVGVSMGGSGLCCTPYDILKVMYCIAKGGVYNGKQLLPKAYIEAAVKKQADPYGKQGTFEELQGYGYQIWRTTHNGYALFGMGGQLAMYVPDKDIFMITTADAQGRQGGVQLIYDAFWDEVYSKLSDAPLPENPEADKELEEFAASRKLHILPGEETAPVLANVNGKTYACDENSCDVSKISFEIDEESKEGTLYYTNLTGNHQIKFGIGHNCIQEFPYYGFRCAASGAWRADNNLLIKIQIIDSAIGNMYISLNFLDDYITVMMRKIEETFFNEYNGVFSGKMVK